MLSLVAVYISVAVDIGICGVGGRGCCGCVVGFAVAVGVGVVAVRVVACDCYDDGYVGGQVVSVSRVWVFRMTLLTFFVLTVLSMMLLVVPLMLRSIFW